MRYFDILDNNIPPVPDDVLEILNRKRQKKEPLAITARSSHNECQVNYFSCSLTLLVCYFLFFLDNINYGVCRFYPYFYSNVYSLVEPMFLSNSVTEKCGYDNQSGKECEVCNAENHMRIVLSFR